MNKSSFTRLDFFLLVCILVVAVGLRLYKINIPLADQYSWRQVDTAAVARNFARSGFDLMHPRYDDLSSIETGKENPQGYRFVEFPLYNAVFGFLYKWVQIFPLEVWGRLTTIFFSLSIIAIIYYLSAKEVDRIAAVFAAGTYAIFPFFVFFSRVVLPETMALALTILSIFFMYLWHNRKAGWLTHFFFLFSAVSFSLALLVKPTTIFFSISLFYLIFKKYGFSFIRKMNIYAYSLIAIVPFLAWRLYIKNFPEGIPASDWLITNVNTYQGLQNIFFKPAFFRWIFFERINNEILGGYLTLFLGLGIFSRFKNYFLHSLVLSSLVYLFVFQGGNVQHEYYQTLILPAIAVMVGAGISLVLRNKALFINRLFVVGLTLLFYLFSLFFSFYKVKDFYSFPLELPQIANVIKSLTRPDDTIVTDRTGDTTLLYLTDRRGAPAIYKDPPELASLGYNYLVTLHKEEANNIEKKYKLKIIFQNDKFTMFKL